MKRIRGIHWFVFLLGLIFLLMPALAFAETTDSESAAAASCVYRLSEGCAIHAQEVDGKTYLFLPASEREGLALSKLSCDSGQAVSATVSGKTYTETVPISFDAATESSGAVKVTVQFSGDGASAKEFYVMKSENLSAMYLTSKKKGEDRTYIDQVNWSEILSGKIRKNKTKKASMVFTSAAGKEIYSGDLKELKARGSSTFKYYKKKSYQIKFDKKQKLLEGAEKGKTWVLLAAYCDPAKMNDKIWKDVALYSGDTYAPKEECIDLYYDGEYRGTYMLSEKNQINGNRIDITDMEDAYDALNEGYGDDMETAKAQNKYKQNYYYTKGLTEPEKKGGFLIELNAASGDEASWFKTSVGLAYNVKSPEYAGQETMAYISEYFEEFMQAIYATNKAGEHTGVNPTTGKHYYEYCDLDSLARMYLLNAVSGNNDGFWRSLYFYKDVDGAMYAGPIWDMELTLGTGWNDPIAAGQDSMATTSLGSNLMQLPSFQKKVQELYDQYFVQAQSALLGDADAVSATGIASIAQRAETVRASVAMDAVIWPEKLRNGSPYAEYPNKSWPEFKANIDTANNTTVEKYSLWPAGTTIDDIVNYRIDWLKEHKAALDSYYNALTPGEDALPDSAEPEKPETPSTQKKDNTDEAKEKKKAAAVYVKVREKNKKATFTWNKIEDVVGYDIFLAKCGSSYKKGVKVSAKKTKKTVSIAGLGTKTMKKSSYKAVVKAYVYKNGKKSYVAKSKTLHFVSGKSSKYTNAKRLAPSKKKLSLKKGKSYTVKVRTIKEKNGRKLLPTTHCARLQWRSSNSKIASVKNGKVTAKKKGGCVIYVAAPNGVSAQVKVTVN